jgi:hypothetical protein
VTAIVGRDLNFILLEVLPILWTGIVDFYAKKFLWKEWPD